MCCVLCVVCGVLWVLCVVCVIGGVFGGGGVLVWWGVGDGVSVGVRGFFVLFFLVVPVLICLCWS